MGYNWANKYMRDFLLVDKRFYRAIMVFVFVFMANICQAQRWSDMTYWLSTEKGAKQLAELAHPMDTYMRHSVVSTESNYIIIEIKYEGIIRNYWCKYKVYKGVYDGVMFFKDITTLREGTRPRSFFAIEQVSDYIEGAEGSFVDKALRYFHNCSWYEARGEYRAAMALSHEFHKYYDKYYD